MSTDTDVAKATTPPVLYVFNESTAELYEAIGIDKDRAEKLRYMLSKVLYDAMVYPYAVNPPTTTTEVLHTVSKFCRNMQEICYVMYHVGYEMRKYDEAEENKRKPMGGMMFPFPGMDGK
jgi:hypothetical protein